MAGEEPKHPRRKCSCGCNRHVSRWTARRHVADFLATEKTSITKSGKRKQSRTANNFSASRSRVDASLSSRDQPSCQSRGPSFEFKSSLPLLDLPPASDLLQSSGDDALDGASGPFVDNVSLNAQATDTVATHPVPGDRSAEIAILSAQLYMAHHKIKVLRGEATASLDEQDWQVERPDNVGNLKAAMGLMNEPADYRLFRADVANFAIVVGLDYNTHWSRQDPVKFARLVRMARRKHAFLKCYKGDWPIKEYLKRRFNNQRSYKRRVHRPMATATAQGKDEGTAVDVVDLDGKDESDSEIDAGDEKSDIKHEGF